MPPDYQQMKTTRLVELLALATEKQTQLLAERTFNEEYEELKESILQLQAIINSRQNEQTPMK
ncbi:MAG TPA: hypothetical protein VF476_14735 [Chitinophagaceae bacterium]